MIELPEAHTLARQLRETVLGRRITKVVANASPHKFAFFGGDPEAFDPALAGRVFDDARRFGGMVELTAGQVAVVFSDGANLRWLAPGTKVPAKHQLAIWFDDGGALVATVSMYAQLSLAPTGALDTPYYRVARAKPCPLTAAFDRPWFDAILAEAKPTISAKAVLATEQRVPGLGNGVLQDILFAARIHPRSRLGALGADERDRMFDAVKTTLVRMTDLGGRDTEKDLFGQPGGYQTILSAKTVSLPCHVCGGGIVRQAYLGGNVYFCPTCQPQR